MCGVPLEQIRGSFNFDSTLLQSMASISGATCLTVDYSTTIPPLNTNPSFSPIWPGPQNSELMVIRSPAIFHCPDGAISSLRGKLESGPL